MAKKGKGFGQSQTPTREAKEFILAFQDHIAKTQGDQTPIHQFFQAHQAKLNESLLEALPLVFAKLTADKLLDERENIARVFVAFGNLIQKFPLGDRLLNLELSITTCKLALKVFLREVFPGEWAGTQNNLGNAYRDRIRGERAENLEQAITAYELALQVYTRETFPEQWAMTQNNLGTAYCKRIRGDREENLERAISNYELALQVYTDQAFPTDWAMVQNNLGNAYGDRIRGERAENLEQAITAFELALQVRTREAFPENWAMTQNNLAVTYRVRIRGERVENLEQAIIAFELALQIYTRNAFPEDWAMTQNNLGLTYGDRMRGERAENLERAIFFYELALQVRTREAFPENWAETQHNLANAYCARILGEQADNLEQAISIYKQAAQVFTRESFPHKWAANQGHLAEALMKRSSLTNNPADLETAITLLQESLTVSVPGSPDFIDSQYRLGNALSRRHEHSQNSSDLEQALQAYKTALDAISPEHYDRKQIWQALPTTQSILGSRLVREGKWQEGLQLLLNSVRQLSTGDDPLAHANALFHTGRAHETLSDWDNARLYYRDALRLYTHLNHQLGMANSQAGLGSVLVSQGHLEKGMTELAKARDRYHQLEKPDKAAEVDTIYQAAQRAIERPAA
jgi:tetratricopeptide (TPR) repeat protein